MGRITHNRAAFTLMELVVSMAVTSAAMVLGLQVYVQTQRAMDRQQVKAAQLGSQSDLLSLLRRDVRAAALIAPQSTASHLILVSADGSRVEYRATPDGVTRMGPPGDPRSRGLVQGVSPRFEYPAIAGRGGRVVRAAWDDGAGPRSITLHLRNQGTL
jgi:type II secretory pathway pseudopilin PulG